MKQSKASRKNTSSMKTTAPAGAAKVSAPARPAPAGPSPLTRLLERIPERRDFWIVLGFAWLVRLVYVALAYFTSPSFDIVLKGLDQSTYQNQANQILSGDILLRQVGLFYYSPLYAYYSALVFKLIGRHSFWALHLAQSFTGALTCALCFALARTWLRRRAALLAGLCYSLLASWLFYEQELLHEGFMLLFYATVLWGVRTAALGRRWPLARLALAGACGLLAMIGRGNAALILLALIPWILLATPPLRPVWHRRLNAAGALAFCLGILVIFAPLMLRNRAVAGHWALGMGNGKVLFYLGNNAQSGGEFEYSERFLAAQEAAAKDPNAYRRFFLEDLKSAPGHLAYTLLRKAWLFCASYDLPDNLNFTLGRQVNLPVRFSPVQWEWLLPLGLIGLALSLRRRRGWGLLWLFSAVFAASLIVIVPIGRYRQPILIPAVIFTMLALEWAAECWRTRRRAALAPAAGAWAVLIVAFWPGWREVPIRDNDYQCVVNMAIMRGKIDQADRLLQQGIIEHPRSIALRICEFDLAMHKDDRDRMRELSGILLKYPPVAPDHGLAIAKLDIADGNLDRARMLLSSLLAAPIEHGEAIHAEARRLLEKLASAPAPVAPAR